jgi:hypothetical protein
MTAVLTDLRELTRPLSAFAAFQLVHFYPRGFQLFIEKDNPWAGETLADTDPARIRTTLPRSLYTRN